MSECLQIKYRKMDRKSTIDQVKSLKSIYDNREYVYKLSHTYEIEPTPLYIKSNISPNVMDLLLVYLQYGVAEYDECYATGQEDLVPVLNEFYNVIQVGKVDGYSCEFDLYENWEKWCGCADDILNIELFRRDGLDESLKEIAAKGGYV